MKNKIIPLMFIFIILLNTYSFAVFSGLPVWSEMSDTLEVSADSNSANSVLNLESESAILIEQSTRKNTF